MKKMETSKKIILFVSVCFIVSLLYSILIFTYSIVLDKSCNDTLLIALISSTGTSLCGAVAFYYNKSKVENIYKIKKSFLQEKYNILKESGLLTPELAQQEILEEVDIIDDKLNSFEEEASIEDNTDININL